MILAHASSCHQVEPTRVGRAKLRHVGRRVRLHRGAELLRVQHVGTTVDDRAGNAARIFELWPAPTPALGLDEHHAVRRVRAVDRGG